MLSSFGLLSADSCSYATHRNDQMCSFGLLSGTRRGLDDEDVNLDEHRMSTKLAKLSWADGLFTSATHPTPYPLASQRHQN
jgi:hypothetical protein